MRVLKLFAATFFMTSLAPVIADDQEEMTVWQIDYSGKPPYQRKAEKVKVADMARFETQDTELVKVTDFSGKPPFKRNVEKLRVVDLAQFETAEEKKFVPAPRRMKHAHHR